MTGRDYTSSNLDSEGTDPTGSVMSIFDADLMGLMGLTQLFEKINNEMEQFISSIKGKPIELYNAALHLLNAGGKRLRSILLLASCKAVGGNPEQAMSFAIATELVQTASLIHDDILDDDSFRRGVESVHKKFGLRFAILAADLLIALALRLLGNNATPELVTHLGDGGIRMCEGQATDILLSPDNPETLNKASYLSLIERKTVSFWKEAARMGAVVGKGTEVQLKALIEYAEKIGYAFQIRDDILDVEGTFEETGKSVLADLRLKRHNFAMITALESCTEEKKQECLVALSQGNLDCAVDLIRETNAVQNATNFALKYVGQAKMIVQNQGFENVQQLENLADFVVKRTR